ncbi:MAG: glutamate 5-kinase [Saprospiraceae bacterium]
MHRFVIKIGTNVLTRPDGLLDLDTIRHLVEQITALRKAGKEVIVISSGAVGAGRSIIALPRDISRVVQRQVLAAVGQIKLISLYAELFAGHGLHCAQVLATKEDFRDRRHYLNMQNCFSALLRDNIVPIVNENDVVSVSELMFTDNDELAGLTAALTGADTLVILSNVDGLLDGPPGHPGSRLIPEVLPGDRRLPDVIEPTRSSFGRGGMATKFRFAQKAASVGITTWIANGKRTNVLLDLLDEKPVGTRFTARQAVNNLKKWMAYDESARKGLIVVNAGAVQALRERVSSLLPVGVVRIDGQFERGDLVAIAAEDGTTLGYGKVQYGAEIARKSMGQKGKKPLVHYDYLYLD